ncbi:MAG: DUF87 domain-containing protein [Desulfurococcales archaeon]|nr:DUF87 domain-containing protein [Desulfurococcales archaeon]
MNVIDILIGVMAAASAILLLYNMRVGSDLKLPLKVSTSGDELVMEIDGRTHRGILYKGEGLPSGEGGIASRLVNLAVSTRVNVTYISNMVKTRRSKMLKHIEDEIRKTELAYTATKHVKYQERLNYLNNLYRMVARLHTPYTGGFSVIVWVPEGDDEALKAAEAFKGLVEAELGIRLKRAKPTIRDALSITAGSGSVVRMHEEIPLPLQQPWDSRGIVIGSLDDESQRPVILSWPRDLEAHMGVFGPTGRGKTVLLAGIASQLGIMSETSLDPYMVAVVDPKGDLAQLLSGIATRRISPGIDECIPLPRLDGVAEDLIRSSLEAGRGKSRIEACSGSLLERGLIVYDLSSLPNEDRNVAASLIISSLALEASEVGLPGRIALIVDEAWRTAGGVAEHLIMALREGRSKGLHLVYATQSPSDVPQIAADNTKTLAVFGGYTRGYTETARRLGLEDTSILLRLPVGMMLLKLADKPPVRVKVLDFKKLLKIPSIEHSTRGRGVRHGEASKATESG